MFELDSDRVIDAFLEQWDGPVSEPLYCLAGAIEEIAESFYEEGLTEVGEGFEALAQEIKEKAMEQ